MRLRRVVVLATVCLMGFCAISTFAQNAELSGRVSDPNGLAVPKGKVQAVNVLTNVASTVETNDVGLFTFASLPPGIYRVLVEKQGFDVIVKPNVELHVEDHIVLNFALRVGSVSTSVTVEAGASMVNTTDAAVSTVVDRQFVENMPLNGRSFQSLIELTPGVVIAKPASGGQLSAVGQRADANYFTIDGVSANVGVSQGNYRSSGAGELPAVTAGGGFNNLVSIDAMQEFKVQTSTFAPEFGRTPGAQVSIVTRSGTNQFHGTAFEYLRNDIFDARDWFTNYYRLRKPAERQNDFGGVFGGPILKNRLFFFFSYEGLRLRQPLTKTEVEPSTAARSQARATMQPLLNAFPVPNVSNGPRTGVFAASYSNPSTLNATSIRVDYALTNKINVFGRYNHAPSHEDTRGAFHFYSLNSVGHTVSNVDTFTAGATATIKPSLVNEFRFNLSRATSGTGVTNDGFGGAVIPPDSYLFQSYPQANSVTDTFAALFLPDFAGYYTSRNALIDHQQQLNFVDMLAWTCGSHTIKAGFDYRRLTPINGFAPYQFVVFFSGVAGALSDTASLFFKHSVDRSSVRPLFQNLSFFAQDTWKATPNLTLTYGVRWDYNPPPSETSGHPFYTATNLNDPAKAALAPAGTPLWNATHANFAPRLGVAYSLRRIPGRELVLRGGAGIFYDLGNDLGAEGTYGFPNDRSSRFFNIPYPVSTADAAPIPYTLNPPYGQVFAFDPTLKLPRTYQGSVSLEQSLGPNQLISVTYLGAAGRKLLRDELLVPGLGLNPTFSQIFVTTNDAYSNYHALQLQYQRRLSRGLQVLASYGWAHALDNASNDQSSSPMPYHSVYNPHLDYSNSDFDVRHSFSTAISYNIPSPTRSWLLRTIAGNWALDSLFRGNSAPPVNIVTGLDPLGVGVFAVPAYARPDVVPNQPFYLYGSQYPGGKRFNTAAFQNPVPQSGVPWIQGNLGRNTLRGFGAWEEDLAIRREFPIHEQIKLRFRAEFFNIFNHPNFGGPDNANSPTNAVNNPLFGLSTTTLAQSLDNGGASFNALYQIGGPRSIQFALKLQF